MKLWGGKTFSENVSLLITTGHKLVPKSMSNYLLFDKVVINLNMLSTSMKDGVGSKCQGWNVITPNGGWSREININVLKEKLNPCEVCNTRGKGSLLSLSLWSKDYVLFLGKPSERVRSQKHSVVCVRPTIIRVPCPVWIWECGQGKRIGVKGNLM